jgi:hypothetical protein
VERRELDAVAVDFADVEVIPHFGNVFRRNMVCCAPDAFGGSVLLAVSLFGAGFAWDGERVAHVVC